MRFWDFLGSKNIMRFWDFGWQNRASKSSSKIMVFGSKSSIKIELPKIWFWMKNRAPKSSSKNPILDEKSILFWSFFERLPKIIKKSRPARSKKWLLDWKSRFSPKNGQKTIKNRSFFELFWKIIQNPSKKYAKGSYTSVGV